MHLLKVKASVHSYLKSLNVGFHYETGIPISENCEESVEVSKG